ncbi:MAG: DUF1297 domain-containing protein, partial [Candidatus Caldarchaeum sp.]
LVLGAHFNANFFHSVVRGRLELHSIDRRIQSNRVLWRSLARTGVEGRRCWRVLLLIVFLREMVL